MPSQSPDPDLVLPFVVFGASKSGTTWLQRICDAHPEVRCHFQVPIFPLDSRSHPEMFVSGAVAFDAGESAFGGVFADAAAEARYNWQLELLTRARILRRDFVSQTATGPGGAERRACQRELHHRMLRGIVRELLCDQEGMRAYGTKAYTDLDLLFEVFPAARLIHIVRDGRDVAVSKRHHMFRRRAYYLGDEKSRVLALLNRHRPSRMAVLGLRKYFGLFDESWFRQPDEGESLFTDACLHKFSTEWARIVRYILAHQRRRPGQCLMVKYEDLRADPAAHIRKIFEFLGVDAGAARVEGAVEATSFARLKKKAKQTRATFFRKGRAGEWRRSFSAADVELFKKCTKGLLEELGYEDSPDWSR